MYRQEIEYSPISTSLNFSNALVNNIIRGDSIQLVNIQIIQKVMIVPVSHHSLETVTAMISTTYQGVHMMKV